MFNNHGHELALHSSHFSPSLKLQQEIFKNDKLKPIKITENLTTTDAIFKV